ncbi:NUDIX domain-containing protein [Streptomyces virginiae]|uniref:NUDIX domain-containing protein n=1 Tax=Streptomyces TaxID=1883 RepID=UPI002E2A6DB0|nr:NUDIX domain-containing protein [Streptomyces sp. NBC_00239]WSX96995.1 NUDIX domain-containing protein [Streptomyces goshikiensis]
MHTAPHPRPAAARIEQTGPGYRPLTKVVLLALRPDGRVALVRRAHLPDRGQLALVGGRLEPAEWLDEAACRGASRTLGIRVGVQDIELSGLLHYRSEQGAGRLCAVFATQRWSGVPRNTAPDRYSEVVWADPGGPPADCRALTHAVLNQYVAGTLYGALAMPPAGPATAEGASAGAAECGGELQPPVRGPAGPLTTSDETSSARPDLRGTK